MRASAFHFVLLFLLHSVVAQPHHRPQHHRHGKRILEEVIDVEVEVWTTVTLKGPAPSGWHFTEHAEETEKTLSHWFTSIQDGSSSPVPSSGVLGPSASCSEKKAVEQPAVSSSEQEDRTQSSSSKTSATHENYPPTTTSKASLTHAAYSPSSTSKAFSKSAEEAPIPSNKASFSSSPSSISPPAASTTIAAQKSNGKYPFSALVAFGDNLSDNGNGSYAHHVADRDNPENTIYGARTWTNAQVAVSFLTDLLAVPMNQNFAFGHAWGGSDAGATLDNTMYVSDFHNTTVAAELGAPGAPPASQQVSTYIAQGVNKAALHFLWIGNNDADMVGFYQQEAFTKNLTTGMTKVVSQLLDAGAPYVFVPNIYPKQLAPITPKYYGWTTQAQQDAFGTFIRNANTALKTALEGIPNSSNKVIYYDANAFLTSVWNNAASYGLTNAKDTNGMPAFCDGDPDQTSSVKAAIAGGSINQKDKNNWGLCVDDHQADTWYWMQYLDMTSRVHELLAGDMNKAIEEHFA